MFHSGLVAQIGIAIDRGKCVHEKKSRVHELSTRANLQERRSCRLPSIQIRRDISLCRECLSSAKVWAQVTGILKDKTLLER